jgi:hypothetical protein
MRFTALALIAAVMSAARIALAEPIHLACEGNMSSPGDDRGESRVISLVIDEAARVVTVHGYAPVSIISEPDSESVIFDADPKSNFGVSTGSVNRVTGEAQIHIITGTAGLVMFFGRCKPAKRLF